MSQEEIVVKIERLSAEFAHIFQILEEAHDLIWAEDHEAQLLGIIAPLQMIIRNFSDLSERIAANGFAIKEGRVNRKFEGERVSNILANLRYVIANNLIENWTTSPARLFDWKCFDRVSSIFAEADRRIDVLAHVIRNQFEPADSL
ncbi:MAG: hypothetical protein AUK48_14615 [Oscillatoriales cyanobacterium CG2_30_44_21]|nr:MAG: hypothetical protein AUK48_14615 [Oscillatoriales cyanobacterium CG2_30_44_21]